jgi:uncharacterized protein YndB with AHSA1/START domain
MTELSTFEAYGVLTEPATLKIQRLLPGPIERVWAYLTDSELRRRWLAAGEMCNDNLHDRWATMRMAGLSGQSRRKM